MRLRGEIYLAEKVAARGAVCAAAFVLCCLSAPAFAQQAAVHSQYPSPAGSVNRYAATQIYAGKPGQASVGITTGAAALAPGARPGTASDALFSSNAAPLSFSAAPAGSNIVFTANPDGGADADFQSKSAVIADVNAANKQVFYSDICAWKKKSDGCDGTILELAYPGDKGTTVIAYGLCKNYAAATHILCCKVKISSAPARKDMPAGSGTEQKVTNCPNSDFPGVAWRRAYTCSGANPETGPWVQVSTNCANYCVAPSPEFKTESCATGYVGTIVKMRSYTCPGPNAGAWTKLIDSCMPEPKWDDCAVPAPETRSVACGGGPGVVTYRRVWKCVNNSPVAGDWYEVSRTCRRNCLESGYVFASAPACCSGSTYINWLCYSCPVCN